VLVALEHLGFDTAFIGKVGADMYGDFLRKTLVPNDVNCEGLISDQNAFTTLAFVGLDEKRERSFAFARKPGADTQLESQEVNKRIIQDSRVFHIGSLSLTDEPAHTATYDEIKIAKSAKCVMSYDPNYRAGLWPSVEIAARMMRSVLPYMDLVKMSEGECTLLTGYSDPKMAAAEIVKGGASVCTVTLGAAGAYVKTGTGDASVPTFPANIIDTTGAGDAFWGGFLAAFLQFGIAPNDISVQEAKMMARTGNAVASLCVSKHGGIPSMPLRSDVKRVLDNS
jgi:fructokinase